MIIMPSRLSNMYFKNHLYIIMHVKSILFLVDHFVSFIMEVGSAILPSLELLSILIYYR